MWKSTYHFSIFVETLTNNYFKFLSAQFMISLIILNNYHDLDSRNLNIYVQEHILK